MDLSKLKPLVQLLALLALVGCASAPKSSQSVNQPAAELASVIGNAEQGAPVALSAGNSLGVNEVIVGRTYFAASGRECRRLRQSSGEPMQRVACRGRDGVWRFARDLRTSSLTATPGSAAAASMSSMSGELTSYSSTEAKPLVPSAGSVLLLNAAGSVSSAPIGSDGNEALMPMDTSDGAIDLDTVEFDSEPLLGDAVLRELNANETLWSFAKRTTGNALNWRAIAERNDILDAKTLAPGTVLKVPAELVSQGG